MCRRRRRRTHPRPGPRALTEAHRRRGERLDPFGPIAWTPDPEGRLSYLERDIAATRQQLTDARARITTLKAEPAILALPPGRLDQERDAWRTRRDAERDTERRTASPQPGPGQGMRPRRPEDLRYYARPHVPGRGIPR